MRYLQQDELETPETGSLRARLLELSDDLSAELLELEEAARDFAVADNEMRKSRAKAFLKAVGKNKEEREANADSGFAEERLECNLAEARKDVCIEKVRSLRAQLSALQALIYARRAENESIRYNQTQTT